MNFLKSLVREIQQDDVPGLAAELAYRFLFALFPFFIFLAALGSFSARWLGIEDPTARLMEQLSTALPSNAASVVETQLDQVLGSTNGGLLSFGVLAALWAASSGVKSVMKAMNRAYDVDEGRPFLKKQLLGLALTVLGSVAFVGGLTLLVVGQVAGEQIAETLGAGGIWTAVVSLSRIPVALLIVLIAVAVLYWAAPNVDLPFRWISPGAVAFVVTWVVATLGFAFYVANFANYNATYGALGAVIVLMLWLYITSFVLLLGAEVNAILQARAEPETIRHPGGETEAERRQARSEMREATRGRTDHDVPPAPPATQEGRRVARRRPLTGALGAAVAGLVITRLIK